MWILSVWYDVEAHPEKPRYFTSEGKAYKALLGSLWTDTDGYVAIAYAEYFRIIPIIPEA